MIDIRWSVVGFSGQWFVIGGGWWWSALREKNIDYNNI